MVGSVFLDARNREGYQQVNTSSTGSMIVDSTTPAYLGTQDLCSSTAVAIISRAAALLARIGPPHRDYPRYTETMLTTIMNAVANVGNPLDPLNLHVYAFVIYGVHEGEIALPSQKDDIEFRLRCAGFLVRPITYEVRPRSNPPIGSVLIEGGDGQDMPLLWVEDREYQVFY